MSADSLPAKRRRVNMTPSRNRLVAHVVLLSFVLDSALAARIAPRPVKTRESAPSAPAAEPKKDEAKK